MVLLEVPQVNQVYLAGCRTFDWLILCLKEQKGTEKQDLDDAFAAGYRDALPVLILVFRRAGGVQYGF